MAKAQGKTSRKKKHAVVLGAGPAGLGAALRLLEHGHQVTLIEAKSFAGGAGASQRMHGCIVDYGPHLFHPTTEEITNLMKQYSGGKYYESEMINKIILKGHTFNYPFRLNEGLTKLSPFLNARIMLDYMYVKTKNKVRPREIKTFEDWGYLSFGRTLYDLCFGSYTARVWGRHPTTISAKLAKEKLSALSMRKILLNLLRRTPQTEGYLGVRHFGYHSDGIGTIYRNMAAYIAKYGTVLYDTTPHSMEVKDGHIRSVTVRSHGKDRKIVADQFISTIPLTRLFNALHVPRSVSDAARKLEYRDILFVNYIINRDRYSSAHMFYLLDTHFTSNRLAEQKNATEKAAPKGKTLLCLEVPCQHGEKLWEDEAEAYRLTENDLKRLGIGKDEIADKFILRYINAYPVFNLGYEVGLDQVKTYLSGFDNLFVAGRQGLYLNIDMHDSIRLGRLAADYLETHGSATGWFPKVNAFLEELKI